MTELIFRYAKFYDYMLSRLRGEEFPLSNEADGQAFNTRITEYWQKYNNVTFKYYKKYNLTLPDFWLAYPVHSKKNLIPFSDPLTLIIKDDLDDVVSTIVHEICHVFFDFYGNIETCDKLWNQIKKTFPNEDQGTQEHIPVIILARAGLRHIMGPEKAEFLLAREKEYEGLARSWEIIDGQKTLSEDPIEAIFNLKIV